MTLGSIMKPRTPTVEGGTYLAVCVGVFFVGEQLIEYKGKKKYEHRVAFVWDLPTELDENGNPKQLTKYLNATNSPKGNLIKMVSEWTSRSYTESELTQFDFDSLLGKACQLTVSVNDSGYAGVGSVIGLPKGVPAPSTNTKCVSFSVNDWDEAGFLALPEWVQNKIKESTQYQKYHAPNSIVDFEETGSEATASPESADGEECPF